MKKFSLLAWTIWFFVFFISLGDVALPFISPRTSTNSYDWAFQLNCGLIFFSVVSSGITILIRHYAIMKPYKNGSYNPLNNHVRFIIVGVLNWMISSLIIFYGTLTYYLTGIMWQYFILSALGFSLLLFHSPRLGSFKKDDGPCSTIGGEKTKFHGKKLNLFSDTIFTVLFCLTIVMSLFGEAVLNKLTETYGITTELMYWLLYGLIILMIIAFSVRAVQFKNKWEAQKSFGSELNRAINNEETKTHKGRWNLFSDNLFTALFCSTVFMLGFGEAILYKVAESFGINLDVMYWSLHVLTLLLVISSAVRAVQVKNKLTIGMR